MSQDSTSILEHTIPIGRRIAEIMKEKGRAFSQQAVASRMGISRETLRSMLTGDRVILDFELRQIAALLKMTVERIKQDDTRQEERRLHSLLQEAVDHRSALEIAERLAKLAVGITERCISLNNLGSAYFIGLKYDEAHDAWLQAYQYANEIKERYNDSEYLFDVAKNIMISFSVRKEYAHLSSILSELEPLFESKPERSGALCYSYAMIEYQKGNKESAKQKLYQSLEYYRMTGDEKNIGQAEQNIGYIEYATANYEKAKIFFEKALQKLVQYRYWYLVTVKDYIKTLIMLGEHERATELIMQSMKEVQSLGHLDLEGRMLLLLSRVSNIPEHASDVVKEGKYGLQVQLLGCKFLIKFYKENYDSLMFMKYYEIAEKLSGKEISDILDEEDL
ncbi:hypothetical protein [Tumebacillus lipolyticus]|uniref:HTH cro/C1-type domain-containing protein n=1 Tax=Tumebacillus lipolyticus TaxID=1280370 RepID=A0ABW4ZV93_9BACL